MAEAKEFVFVDGEFVDEEFVDEEFVVIARRQNQQQENELIERERREELEVQQPEVIVEQRQGQVQHENEQMRENHVEQNVLDAHAQQRQQEDAKRKAERERQERQAAQQQRQQADPAIVHQRQIQQQAQQQAEQQEDAKQKAEREQQQQFMEALDKFVQKAKGTNWKSLEICKELANDLCNRFQALEGKLEIPRKTEISGFLGEILKQFEIKTSPKHRRAAKRSEGKRKDPIKAIFDNIKGLATSREPELLPGAVRQPQLRI